MVVRGRVRNGVVVLDQDAQLPEGQEVTVLAPSLFADRSQSILDIRPVSLGAVISPLTAYDEVLGEMLESRS